MKSQRTLLVCEFITGGGLAGTDLPESLAREGSLMRDALLRDLSTLDDWQVLTTHDARLEVPIEQAQSLAIQPEQDVWTVWRECMALADAIWVIAPESDHVLLRLAELADATQAQWIGAELDAIEIASNKHQMARVLSEAKLPVIPTFFYDDWEAIGESAWVVKPNDGAGCESTYVLNSVQAVQDWFATDLQRKHTHIIQPYLAGLPASISVLGLKDKVVVLSCNLQSIRLHDGQLSYIGGIVNGASEHWLSLSALANQIKTVLPGLMGYFGIDVLLNNATEHNLTIVEINPRLTTSYVYLNEAMGCNPAHLVMHAMLDESVDVSAIKRNRVEFEVEHAL